MIIIDHVIPLCFGGTNDIDNLQALCAKCDKFKTGYLDYKVIKKIANNDITSNQVLGLQHEYFNKIMVGNRNNSDCNNPSNLHNLNINKHNNNIMFTINGISISINTNL